MFTRITQRVYRNFITTQDKNYNWGTPKMNRISKKLNKENRVILNKKNLAEKIILINLMKIVLVTFLLI